MSLKSELRETCIDCGKVKDPSNTYCKTYKGRLYMLPQCSDCHRAQRPPSKRAASHDEELAKYLLSISRPIPGYNGAYAATSAGHILTVARKYAPLTRELRTATNKKTGYKSVMLKTTDGLKKVVSVHRLVALTWLPNPDDLPQVNHIDANKANNAVVNLEWCTAKENAQHAMKMGLLKRRADVRKVIKEEL